MNLEQLNAMTDLELDEAVAMAQKWTVINGKWKTPVYNNENEEVVGNYHPTANTTEGKARAFDLMVKYETNVWEFIEMDAFAQLTNHVLAKDIVRMNPQRAIGIAVILSAQEK